MPPIAYLCFLLTACELTVPSDQLDFDSDGDSLSNAVETDENNLRKHPQLNPDFWDTNPTIASGTHKIGALVGGLNLPDTGRGYIHYLGGDSITHGRHYDDWGTLALIKLIEATSRGWAAFEKGPYGPPPRVQPGDMSLEFGGDWSPDHSWHENGTEVDARYLRFDQQETPLDICFDLIDHDDVVTEALLDLFVEKAPAVLARVDTIMITSCMIYSNPSTEVVIDASGVHDDHFHLLIRDPDGTAN